MRDRVSRPAADRLVHLVRHAASAVDPSRPPHAWGLTEAGRSGAALVAERLAGRGLTALATSREPKALATASAIGVRTGLEPRVIDGLEEHHRATSAWLGPDEFHATIRRIFERPDVLAYGEETGAAARRRFAAALASVADPARGDVAVVTGATVICLHAGGYDLWRRLRMPAIVVVGWPSGEIVEVVERLDS
jgi:broad specificity phosphatase PhoE